MVTLQNNTESMFLIPVMGEGAERKIKQRVEEGCLVEEEVMVTFNKVVDEKVLEPTFSHRDRSTVEVTEDEYKMLKDNPAFNQYLEMNDIEKVG